MKLTDYAKLLNLQIVVTFQSNLGYWQAHFPGADFVVGIGKDYPYGTGCTPEKAIESYVVEIRGKSMTVKGLTVTVPKELCYEN